MTNRQTHVLQREGLSGASVAVFLLALQLMARELALRPFVAALKPSLIPPFGGVQSVMCVTLGF